MENVKICYDRVLSDEQFNQAARLSVDENTANIPLLPESLLDGGSIFDMKVELAAEERWLWKPGRVLRCRFMGGDPAVQSKVEAVAHQWEAYANIKFAFGIDPDAEIRIAFINGAGSWSYLGMQALVIAKDQPTMNYGWLTPQSSDLEYNRVVLHEFGHALGCIHEHQNPSVDIPWDKPEVYRYYGGPPNNWPPEKVDTNLFKKYSAASTQFSEFDRESIMLYPIDNRLTTGDYEVGWNRNLSEVDREFINVFYPFEGKPEERLILDEEPVEASIGVHGEEDIFTFQIGVAGTYTIETAGPTDVNMGLYGPDDATNQIAFDEDSGQSLNAKITRELARGSYRVRVRHFRPRGTGNYSVTLRSGQ